jgi:AcrR family transcriptional regulator
MDRQPKLDKRTPSQSASRIARRRTLARNEFVDAARLVIETHGFQRFSLELVGREVGLRKQALYHYFDSREALLFEVMHAEHARAADAVSRAVASTTSGADAVEAMLRTYFAAFKGRHRLFQLSHTVLPMFDPARLFNADRLARLRPLNDLLFSGVAERIAHDRGSGSTAEDARRLAFVAYTSVIGLLTMKSLVESADDPLRHADDQLLDTLVSTYRSALETKRPRP